jgi:pimeloyl-ACP methyl ester carboxylesterase
MSKSIVFVHGLFVNPYFWQNWQQFFEAHGFACYAPAYPFHEGRPADLRVNPDPRLGKLHLKDVVAHTAYKQPILIGHSMGGLIVQQLINMNQGAAGVCITSAPPKGVMALSWSLIKANLPVVNPFKGNSIFHGSKNWFHYSIANTLTREAGDAAYEAGVVPESRNIPRSSTGKEGIVDFKKPHTPLLFIGAGKDHIVPITLNRKNSNAYQHAGSRVAFKEYMDRSHFICNEAGWEQVAGDVYEWIKAL